MRFHLGSVSPGALPAAGERGNMMAWRVCRVRAWWRGGLRIAIVLPALLWGCGGDSGGGGASGMAVHQTNLVADVQAAATTPDGHLVNAWGIVHGPATPFWISDNGTGVSTLYDGSGQLFPTADPLVVTIPPPTGSAPGTVAKPTGIVFNGSTTDFVINEGANAAASLFIFATEDGTISGWSNKVDPGTAILKVDNSASGAIYKGLALASNGTANFLYATNFNAGRVEVFNNEFGPATPSGSFVDPNLPTGFAPFGIAAIGGNLYVTYAEQDDNKEDDVKGAGNGFVDVFSATGTLMSRFATRGTLNSPWGVVQAPAGFGSLGNAILVGNFGDGRINAFDSKGTFLGQLTDGQKTLAIDGLWGLEFGNGGNGGAVNTLYFTAGPDDEMHGLFGMLEPLASGM